MPAGNKSWGACNFVRWLKQMDQLAIIQHAIYYGTEPYSSFEFALFVLFFFNIDIIVTCIDALN